MSVTLAHNTTKDGSNKDGSGSFRAQEEERGGERRRESEREGVTVTVYEYKLALLPAFAAYTQRLISSGIFECLLLVWPTAQQVAKHFSQFMASQPAFGFNSLKVYEICICDKLVKIK